MALEFDEQLSRLEKPNRNEMTNKEYAVFNENVETMEKNWGFINNLFKVLPLNASQYIGFLDFKGSLFNPDTCYLTNADKEMIGVVVSSLSLIHIPLRQGSADGEAVCPVRVCLVCHQARRRDRRDPDREPAQGGLQRPRDPGGRLCGRLLQLHQPLGFYHRPSGQSRSLQPQPQFRGLTHGVQKAL